MVVGFVFRNVEDGKYLYFNAHGINLLLGRPQLIGVPTRFIGVTEECRLFEHCRTECTREIINQMEVFICYECGIISSIAEEHSCWL